LKSSLLRSRLPALAAVVFIVSLIFLGALVARKPGFLAEILRRPGAADHPAGANAVKNTTQPGRPSIESTITRKLSDLEVRPADIAVKYSQQDRSLAIQAAVPKGKPFEWVVRQLSDAVEGTSYRVSDCLVDEKKLSCTMVLSSSSKRDPQVTLVVTSAERFLSGNARMAFVVEDLEDTAYQIAVGVLSFPEPLTISLVPAGKKAPLIAQLAEQYKKEVVVRLPLEPAGKVPPELQQSTIMVHYSEQSIRAMVSAAAQRIINVKGYSNLWGSRALEDSRVMTIVFEEIKKQRGYFIETKSARNSVAGPIAQRLAVPYENVTARLDNAPTPDLVAEIKRDAAIAQLKGFLVVRCAGTRRLGDALKAALPFLRQNGVRLVFVSDIVKRAAD